MPASEVGWVLEEELAKQSQKEELRGSLWATWLQQKSPEPNGVWFILVGEQLTRAWVSAQNIRAWAEWLNASYPQSPDQGFRWAVVPLGRWVRGTGGTFHLPRSWVIYNPELARGCPFSPFWLTSIYHFLFLGDLWQDSLFEIVWPKDFKRSTSCVGYFIKGPFFSTCGAQLGGGILLEKPALKYPYNT